LAKSRAEIYVKEKNEDFRTLLSGIMGQKKRIHIALGDVLDREINDIFGGEPNLNRQMSLLSDEIDKVIISNYQLWPTNYIALDMLYGSSEHREHYTTAEKEQFENRLRQGVDMDNPIAVQNFLSMYANPVINKQKVLISKPSEKLAKE